MQNLIFVYLVPMLILAVVGATLGRFCRNSRFGNLLRRPSFVVLMCLLTIPLMALTCTPATLQEIGNMIPSLASIVTGIFTFVSTLGGKTIPATTAANIQQDATDAQNEITNVESVVNAAIAAKEAPNATLMTTLQITFNAIGAKVQSFIANAGVVNQAAQAKLSALADIGIGVINTILGVIAGAVTATKEHSAGRMSEDNLKTFDKQTANHLKDYHNQAKAAWKVAITTKTEDVDVNAALALLKPLP